MDILVHYSLFIFSTRKTNPPPPLHTHTHTHHHHRKRTPHPCSVSHIPVRSQTSRFGSGPSCPSRVPIPTARPTRPNRVCARPEGFSSQSAPAWSPVSRPSQPAADRPRRPELRACYAFHPLLLLRRLPLAPRLSCIMNNGQCIIHYALYTRMLPCYLCIMNNAEQELFCASLCRRASARWSLCFLAAAAASSARLARACSLS